jgi:FeS assembly SUF system protein
MSENPGTPATTNDISVTPATANDDPTMASTTNDNVISLRDRVEEALRTVYDPEIPVNIFDLGLVYETLIDGGKVKITMTLTAPACPVAGEIIQDVQQKIEAIEGVIDCHVNLTFDPPWTKEMMTEEAKLELGFL